jgi:hypothetical protein
MANQTGRGYFPPGVSGNPGGRPLGFSSLIRSETREGADLVAYVVKVFRDDKTDTDTRMAAATWLADRGFGRPVQTTQLTGADGGAVSVAYDLTRLSDKELDQFEHLSRKLSNG